MKYDKYAQQTIFSSKYCKFVDFWFGWYICIPGFSCTFVSLLGLLMGRFGENQCHLPSAWRADFGQLRAQISAREKQQWGNCEPLQTQRPAACRGSSEVKKCERRHQNPDDENIDHWLGGDILEMVQLHKCHCTLVFDSGLEATSQASVMTIPLSQAFAIYNLATLCIDSRRQPHSHCCDHHPHHQFIISIESA